MFVRGGRHMGRRGGRRVATLRAWPAVALYSAREVEGRGRSRRTVDRRGPMREGRTSDDAEAIWSRVPVGRRAGARVDADRLWWLHGADGNGEPFWHELRADVLDGGGRHDGPLRRSQ